MQLRIHPKMKWEGCSNWPPTWHGSHGPVDIFPEGEEGVLTGVEMVEANYALPRHLTLTMEYRGNPSAAPLHCDEEEVLPRLLEILKDCVGWEISVESATSTLTFDVEPLSAKQPL